MFEVRTPTAEDIAQVFGHKSDAWINRPDIDKALDVQALYHDGRPIAIWGVNPVNAVSDKAWVWVYTSDPKKARKSVFKYAKVYVQYQATKYRQLLATVVRGNTVSQRWTAWLGFTVDPELEKVYISSKHQVMRYHVGHH